MDAASAPSKRAWEANAPAGGPLRCQAFLRDPDSGGLGALTERFGVRARRHNTYRNLVLLKYSQLSAPFHLAVTRECRGIVLDEDRDWAVVCFPYAKFFNADEPLATMMRPRFDWSSARVYEKLDGSLATLYHYAGEWHVASSGTPDGDGELGATQGSFAQLFWSVWQALALRLPTDTSRCYIFEMLSRAHPIVVMPVRDAIVLHGVRDLTTLQEVAPEPVARELGWECVQVLPLHTQDQIDAAVRKLNPHQQEGFVVVDCNWTRLKIKSPQYVALSFLDARGDAGLNEQKMLKIVRENESDEFLSYYKQWRALCAYVRERYDTTVRVLTAHVAPAKKRAAKAKTLPDLTAYPALALLLDELAKNAVSTDLGVREQLARLPITKCEAVVDALSPVNQERRNAMLDQQREDMDAMGINTKKKASVERAHEGAYADQWHRSTRRKSTALRAQPMTWSAMRARERRKRRGKRSNVMAPSRSTRRRSPLAGRWCAKRAVGTSDAPIATKSTRSSTNSSRWMWPRRRAKANASEDLVVQHTPWRVKGRCATIPVLSGIRRCHNLIHKVNHICAINHVGLVWRPNHDTQRSCAKKHE